MTEGTVFQTILDSIAPVSHRQVWGIMGDAINPLADALRTDDRFEWMHVRHEEVAAFAAGAQAKLTGQLGICAGTVGPGAIHLLNGLYDAKMDHAPVLAITGQVPRSEIGSDYHQEVNVGRLFDDVCVYNQTVMSSCQMPRMGVLAAQSALAHSGVAHLSIPSDVGPDKIKEAGVHKVFVTDSEVVPAKKHLEEIADAINSSPSVTLMVGWGARGATKEVLAMAEKLQAPVVHSLKGKAVLDQDNPFWAGGLGLLGTTGGVEAVSHCDTLVLLGTDYPYRQFLPKHAKIIQIDIAAERIGRRCDLSIGAVGHIRPTLEALLPMVDTKTDSTLLLKVQKKKASYEKKMAKKGDVQGRKAPIRPQAVARAICRHATDSAIFIADTGEPPVWMARHIHMKGTRDFLMSFNHASMANAMPQALGAQALDKSRQVIALCGDGGFSMLMGDFITAVTYDLPIKCIVFNNSKLGLVKMEMESMGYADWGIDLKNPNFADCGIAMGGKGIRIENPADLDAGIKEALAMDGPVVVDVVTDSNELTMPPEIMPARAWGFAISKIKELVVSSSV
ncbi:MAG: pyruvate oxidase [Phycisphaerae bacterium]|nr:pyruvate oxidase [Phycisphaerae bacterium]MBT6165171.1 pyruvate oxidase [Phycisphaerae bacterium]